MPQVTDNGVIRLDGDFEGVLSGIDGVVGAFDPVIAKINETSESLSGLGAGDAFKRLVPERLDVFEAKLGNIAGAGAETIGILQGLSDEMRRTNEVAASLGSALPTGLSQGGAVDVGVIKIIGDVEEGVSAIGEVIDALDVADKAVAGLAESMGGAVGSAEPLSEAQKKVVTESIAIADASREAAMATGELAGAQVGASQRAEALAGAFHKTALAVVVLRGGVAAVIPSLVSLGSGVGGLAASAALRTPQGAAALASLRGAGVLVGVAAGLGAVALGAWAAHAAVTAFADKAAQLARDQALESFLEQSTIKVEGLSEAVGNTVSEKDLQRIALLGDSLGFTQEQVELVTMASRNLAQKGLAEVGQAANTITQAFATQNYAGLTALGAEIDQTADKATQAGQAVEWLVKGAGDTGGRTIDAIDRASKAVEDLETAGNKLLTKFLLESGIVDAFADSVTGLADSLSYLTKKLTELTLGSEYKLLFGPSGVAPYVLDRLPELLGIREAHAADGSGSSRASVAQAGAFDEEQFNAMMAQLDRMGAGLEGLGVTSASASEIREENRKRREIAAREMEAANKLIEAADRVLTAKLETLATDTAEAVEGYFRSALDAEHANRRALMTEEERIIDDIAVKKRANEEEFQNVIGKINEAFLDIAFDPTATAEMVQQASLDSAALNDQAREARGRRTAAIEEEGARRLKELADAALLAGGALDDMSMPRRARGVFEENPGLRRGLDVTGKGLSDIKAITDPEMQEQALAQIDAFGAAVQSRLDSLAGGSLNVFLNTWTGFWEGVVNGMKAQDVLQMLGTMVADIMLMLGQQLVSIAAGVTALGLLAAVPGFQAFAAAPAAAAGVAVAGLALMAGGAALKAAVGGSGGVGAAAGVGPGTPTGSNGIPRQPTPVTPVIERTKVVYLGEGLFTREQILTQMSDLDEEMERSGLRPIRGAG